MQKQSLDLSTKQSSFVRRSAQMTARMSGLTKKSQEINCPDRREQLFTVRTLPTNMQEEAACALAYILLASCNDTPYYYFLRKIFYFLVLHSMLYS